MGRTRRDIAGLAALTGLVLAFFLPVVLYGETFFLRDTTFNHMPRKHVAVEMFLDGSLPLWNPYLNLGEPLLGNPNNVAAHPSNLLFLVLPFFAAFNGAVLLEFAVSAAALFLLLRRLSVRTSAAVVAAAAYTLSGPLLSLGNFWNALASAAPAPLALLAADCAARRGSVRGPLCLGGLWALQMSGGEPVVTLTTMLLAAGYLVVVGGVRTGFVALAKALAWAASLGAVVWLPAMAFAAGSARAEGLALEEVTAWSVHPATLLEVVVPGLFGDPTIPSEPFYWGAAFQHRGMPYILSLGIANVTLVLAFFGSLGRERRNRFLAVAALVFLLLALGKYTPLFPLLARWVPGATMLRFPVKLFFAVNLCLGVLCGLGLERILAGRVGEGTIRRAVWIGLAAGAAALIAAWLVPDPPAAGATLPALALAAVALVSTLAIVRFRPAGTPVLLAGLVLLELWPAHSGLNPTASTEVFRRPPAAAELLQADAASFRIHRRPTPPDMTFREAEGMSALRSNAFNHRTLVPNYAVAHGLGYGLNTTSDALDRPAARLLGSYAESLPWEGRLGIFGVANIKYVLSFDPIEADSAELVARLPTLATRDLLIYRNRRALPRAFVAGSARRVDDLREACLALGDRAFDPRTTVVLSGTDAGPGGATSDSTVVALRNDPNRVVFEVEADGPGHLVLLDAYAPGWTATVDGEPVTISRADVCFRAVPVGAGTHTVEFRYRPRPVLYGFVLTLAGLVLGAVVLVRGRTGQGPPSP